MKDKTKDFWIAVLGIILWSLIFYAIIKINEEQNSESAYPEINIYTDY